MKNRAKTSRTKQNWVCEQLIFLCPLSWLVPRFVINKFNRHNDNFTNNKVFGQLVRLYCDWFNLCIINYLQWINRRKRLEYNEIIYILILKSFINLFTKWVRRVYENYDSSIFSLPPITCLNAKYRKQYAKNIIIAKNKTNQTHRKWFFLKQTIMQKLLP